MYPTEYTWMRNPTKVTKASMSAESASRRNATSTTHSRAGPGISPSAWFTPSGIQRYRTRVTDSP